MSKSAVSAPIAARDLFDHVLLSILWGASFLFMRIAVPEFGPWPLMGLRCLIGAITLVALLVWYREIKRIGDNFVLGMGMGVLNSAIPFVLLAYAALAVSSGLLSIINAMAPFWGALFGWLWLRSPLTRWQALGLVLGFAGVVVLMITSTNSLQVNVNNALFAVSAGVLATIFYGYAVNFAKRYLPNSNALVNATNSQIGAALALAVPTVLWWPIEPVSTLAWFSVVTLGVFCTGLAYVLYFRLIHRIGASRAITVVFVIPIFATLFGVVFLQETLSISMVVSGLIIMLGSAFSLQLLPRK